MQASADFADRARAWACEINETLATRSQLTRRGMELLFGVVALLCTALLLQVLITRSGPSYLGLLLNLALALGALGWLRKRQRVPRGLLLTVCSVLVLNHLVLVYFNGELPLMLLTPLVVMAHLLLNPTPALTLTAILLVGAQAIVWAVHPAIPTELWLRTTGVNLGLLLVLQVVTRYWLRVSVSFRDISDEMVQVQRGTQHALLQSQAQRDAARYTDATTGLLNRAGFERALAEHFRTCAPGHRAGVVIWGPQAEGAEILARMQPSGGDAEQQGNASGQALAVVATDDAGQLLALLPTVGDDELPWSQRIQAWMQTISPEAASATDPSSLCAGFAVWPEDGAEAQGLLRRAELARDMARSLVSGKPLRFEPEMEERAERQARLLADMEAGLARGEFELHYQPIVPAGGGALHKAEALIRWNHPQRGRVSPGEFIPAAEQSYLIVEMTDKILEMATEQVRQWRQELHPDFQISVNMPPAYLAKCARHPGQMLPRLQALRAPVHSIVLEITEGALLEVDDELLQALQLVRDQGFLIALDDFGIGYSSFGKLPRLPLDFLKLDKSFVDALDHGAAAHVVCHTIVSLAHDLGMKVVAEGVEGETQRAHLLRMETDFFQGYLFSRPLAVRDFAIWARSQGQANTPDPLAA
jgi:EAL domain-containing protein (putative c-di-GMP-specific phosphodiesterase class I)